MDNKPFVLAVVGPTASGKTWLGVELAKEYGGEVVSADSMQIYKGMDIASAKPTAEEMQGVPHHLISAIDRDTPFSAADYVKMAREVIADILSRGKLPIIVGGTGLYVDSLLNNVQFSEMKSDPAYREILYALARERGNEALYAELAAADPVAAESIHMNNTIRVVRALEVIHLTGRLFSELKAENIAEESPYDSLFIALSSHFDLLVDIIYVLVLKRQQLCPSHSCKVERQNHRLVQNTFVRLIALQQTYQLVHLFCPDKRR